MIEVFADVLCPFTHVGLRKVMDLRAEVGSSVPVVVRAWPLEWVNGAPLDAGVVAQEVEALRASVVPDRFAGFERDRFPRTSVPALGLAAVAYARDVATGEAFSLAVRDAVFEEGRDVADPGVLDALAASFELDRSIVTEQLVRAEYERGQRLGVVGSPYFLVAGAGFFCPSLEISHVEGRFAISFDAQEFARFVERALVPET